MSKVILIGIDGATWNIIDPLIRKGYLPNLKRLKSLGLYGNLKSTYPPSSPPAWNSLFSGMNPGKHKIFDFVKRKKNSYFIEPIFSEDRKSPLVWDYLTKNGKKTVAISIPFAYPPGEINGLITTGLGTPSKNSDFTFPRELKKHILKKYPNFDVDFEEHIFDFPKDKNLILEKVREVTESEFLLAKDLFKERNWDLFTAVFRSTDVIQHYFMDDKQIIEQYYSQVDKIVGWFMNNLKKDMTFLVCSDHGFKEVHTKFYLNNWLNKNQFMEIKKRSKQDYLNIIDADKVERFFTRFGLKKLVWNLKKSYLLELFVKYFAKSSRLDYLQLINWERTKLYYLGTSNGLIYVNQRGREPAGLVEFEDRKKLIEEFKKKLKSLSYKNKKVIDKIFSSDEIFTPRTKEENFPDIVVTLRSGFILSGGFSETGKMFEKDRERNGDHDPDGIICIYRKGVRDKKRSKKEYKIYDVVPTILNELGITIQEDFDGKPIKY